MGEGKEWGGIENEGGRRRKSNISSNSDPMWLKNLRILLSGLLHEKCVGP